MANKVETIKVGKCPVCDSIQTEVRIDENRLSARAKCIRCGEEGARIKVSRREDIPLACEVAARTFSTKIIDDDEEEEEGPPKLREFADIFSAFLGEMCGEATCDDCVMRSDFSNRFGIKCYNHDSDDVRKSLSKLFPGWK